jgi:hypothetical protein
MYIPNGSGVFNTLIVILAVWTIPWKGYSLWLSAKRDQKIWFIVLLVVNTVSILEIFYVFRIAKKSWADIKADWRSLKNSFKKKEEPTVGQQ